MLRTGFEQGNRYKNNRITTFSPLKNHPKLSFIVILFILIMSGCADNEERAFIHLIDSHLKKYPQMQAVDMYKLAYQGANGVTHFIANRQAAMEYLARELAATQPSDATPLIEPVSPDGELVRLNLAPYTKAGGGVEPLFQAMIKTADEVQPSNERLEKYLRYLLIGIKEGEISFDRQEMESFVEQMRAAGYPAVHHSGEYMRLYQPAYRVVLKKYLPAM